MKLLETIGIIAIVLAIFIAAYFFVLFISDPTKCADFETQERAEEVFQDDRKKFENLDRDNDEKPCENLPSKTRTSIFRKIIPKAIAKPTPKPTQRNVISTQKPSPSTTTISSAPENGTPKPSQVIQPTNVVSPTPSFTPEPTKSPTPTPRSNILPSVLPCLRILNINC
jgi:hypothetical protein